MDLLELFKSNSLKLDKWMWSRTLARLYNQDEKEKLENNINAFLEDHRDLPLGEEIT